MKTEKIGNRNIVFTFNLPGWDLNLHLIIGQKSNYLIDTGLGSDCIAPIKEYLKSSAKPIVVINTHHHWDHIWGNGCFNNSTIISHSLCRSLIVENWCDMLHKGEPFIQGDVKQCLPNLVFENGIYFPDDKIRIIYTPGHTVDSISVLDEENGVLNAGDNIGDTLDEIVPSIKVDTAVFMESLNAYRQLEFNACVSGHNIILGKDIFDKIEKLLQG